jgi:hypothetical protein
VKPAIFYRIACGLLLTFAVLHTWGFRQVDPAWGVDTVVRFMQSTHFDLLGSSRTYWDLYAGFGLLFSVFLVFAAVLVWQLSSLPDQALALMRGTAWALVICFAAVTFVCLGYAFILPTAFSVLILLCLTAAAMLSARPTSR